MAHGNDKDRSTTSPSVEGLRDEARDIVDDEQQMAARVSRRLSRSLTAKSAVQGPAPELDAQLISLRDQMGEARAEDVPALLAEMMRLSAVRSVDAPEAQGAVDPRSPYFGHLRLEETVFEPGRKTPTEKRRDVLIGKRGLVDREAGVVIVDWRNAPISRIYYRYDEGDDYDEDFGREERSGVVLARRTVSFRDGALVRVKSTAGTFVVADETDGSRRWVELPQEHVRELTGGVGTAVRAPRARPQTRGRRGRRRGRSAAARQNQRALGHTGPSYLRPDKHLPEIAALIDPTQFEAMTRPNAGVVVLQGGAGSGKTTVALHRIAYLAFADPDRFRPHRMTVVVQQPALVHYVARVLPGLDVGQVRVQSYLDFCRFAVRTLLPEVDRDLIEDAPREVAAFKKHPGLLQAIVDQSARRLRAARASLAAATAGCPEHPQVCALLGDDDTGRPLAQVFDRALTRLAGLDISANTRERARRALEQHQAIALDIVGQWEELIGDDVLLGPIRATFDPAAFDSALRWTAEQVADDDDDQIDPASKRPVDGRAEERGPRRMFDAHDLPLLLNLCVERFGSLRGPSGRAVRYDHVAIDEAQDLAAVEVRPLIAAAGPTPSVTLAGDIVQKIVFDNGFETWGQLLAQLQVDATCVEPFRLTYRSTREVVAFGQEVLGPLAPKTPPSAARSGAPVDVFAFDEAGEALSFLADNLRSVMGREPQASVAVLARYPERAAFYARMLKQAEVPHLRHVAGADFSFSAGIDVTHIGQVKGLEYDYVILVDVTADMYPAQDAARHLLHIGATRAAHQLWLLTSRQNPSPLLPPDLLD